MVLTAIIAAFVGFFAQHLGIVQAVLSVVSRIGKCPKCTCFWVTLFVLVYVKCNILVAILLSILGSYMSIWLGLVFVWLNKKYNLLWQRLNKEQ
jgi:hypothetical protein